jgi:hypothetical protein
MARLRMLFAAFAFVLLTASAPAAPGDTLDALARDYVALVLEIGERDEGYVDAYYGPAEWRAAAHANPRSLADLRAASVAMQARLAAIETAPGSMEERRKRFLQSQLGAAQARLEQLGGTRLSFADEARRVYGVEIALRPLSDYEAMLERIDRLVPGRGPLTGRVDAFMDRFAIRPDRLDSVLRAAIGECRRRTLAHIPLPAEEAFTLEFVTDKSWSGYNWYQGNYRSLIQINTDQRMRLGRAIDIGCHEGYPGHHVYNVLLERELARGRGWVEYMVYPLYSPQSFIAEGSANYGAELAFPGAERLAFERRVLYPLAGIPSEDAEAYIALQEAVEALAGARFTIARDLIDGRITRERAIELTERYSFVTRSRAEQSIAFTLHYRAYVINYGLGEDMVRSYIQSLGAEPARRWAAMAQILSEPTLPGDLVAP